MKKQLIEIKKKLNQDFLELEALLRSEGLKSLELRDGDWVETPVAILDIFKPKFEGFLKKVDKLANKLTRKRKNDISRSRRATK